MPAATVSIWPSERIRNAAGENLRVWLERGHLFGARENAPAHEYLPRSECIFFTRDSGASYIFSRDAHGRVASLSILSLIPERWLSIDASSISVSIVQSGMEKRCLSKLAWIRNGKVGQDPPKRFARRTRTHSNRPPCPEDFESAAFPAV